MPIELGSAYAKISIDASGAKRGAQEAAAAFGVVDAKSKRLTQTLEEQRRRYNILVKELSRVAAKYGESSMQAEKKRLALHKLLNQVERTEDALHAHRRALMAVDEATEHTTESTGRLGRVLEIGIGSAGGILAAQALGMVKDAAIDAGRATYQAVREYERMVVSLEALEARSLLASGAASSLSDAMQQAAPKVEALLRWVEQLPPNMRESARVLYQQALNFGFASDEAVRLTEALANYAAGSGRTQAEIERIALALGQIESKGKVSAEELNQLREAGLGTNDILADLGYTLDDVSKGLVDSDTFVQALVGSLEQDFAGAGERAMDTLAGIEAAGREVLAQFQRDIGTDFFTTLQPALTELIALLDSKEFRGAVQAFGGQLGDGAAMLAEGITNATAAAVAFADSPAWESLKADLAELAESAERLEGNLRRVNEAFGAADAAGFDEVLRASLDPASTLQSVFAALSDLVPLVFEAMAEGSVPLKDIIGALSQVELFAQVWETQLSLISDVEEGASVLAERFDSLARLSQAAGDALGLPEVATNALRDALRALADAFHELPAPLQALIAKAAALEEAEDKAERTSEKWKQSLQDKKRALDNAALGIDGYTKNTATAAAQVETLVAAIRNLNNEGYIDDRTLISEEEIAKRTDALEQLVTQAERVRETEEKIAVDLDKIAKQRTKAIAAQEAEIADLYTSYQAKRRKAETATATALRAAEQELHSALATLAEKRRALEEDTQAERAQIAREATDALVAAEEAYSDAVAELTEARTEAVRSYTEARAEIAAEATTKAQALEAEYTATVARLAEERTSITRTYTEARVDAEAAAVDARKQLETEYTATVERLAHERAEAERELASTRAGITADLLADLEQLEASHLARVASLQDRITDLLGESLLPADFFDIAFEELDTDAIREAFGALGAATEHLDDATLQDAFDALSDAEQQQLAESLERLKQQEAAYAQQVSDRRKRAQQAINEAEQQHAAELAALERALDAEKQAHTAALAEHQQRLQERLSALEDAYRTQLAALNTTLAEETRAYEEAQRKQQARLDEQLHAIEATHTAALEALDMRLAEEATARTEQAEAIANERAANLAALETQYAEQVAALDSKHAAEVAAYEAQRGKLEAKLAEQLADMQASYEARVATAREKLGQIEARHEEQKQRLLTQLDEARQGFQEKLDEIAGAWQAPMDATARYQQYLSDFQQWLALTTFPVNFQGGMQGRVAPGYTPPLAPPPDLNGLDGLERTSPTSTGGLHTPTSGGTTINVESLVGGHNTFTAQQMGVAARTLGNQVEAGLTTLMQELIQEGQGQRVAGSAHELGSRY